MLADITNAHKKARTTSNWTQSKSPHIIALQNLVKDVTPSPKMLSRPTSKKQKSNNKQCMGSKAKVIYEPTLPAPENTIKYSPIEAYRILKQLEGKQRYSAIKKMVKDELVLVGTSRLYSLLKLDESKVKAWWNEGGRPHILDTVTLEEEIKKTQQ